jgi:predicted AAA+ superfamily ATPase
VPTTRTIAPAIRADLPERLAFVAGPRQIGKTTLARQILDSWQAGEYFSWDRVADRRRILAAEWPAAGGLIVLDELHKYRRWKRWIKGEFDSRPKGLSFLVTGSARMDVYRRGGDSLQGRYHHYRLHPFTVGELLGRAIEEAPRPFEALDPLDEQDARASAARDAFATLVRFGGFPEPCFAGSERVWRRWQKERFDRFFREDVRDLEALPDLSGIQLLADMLPARVGSPLSVNALREDLDVSHKAATHWLEILERLYFSFRIRPHATRSSRSLRKMPKLYLWDSSLVDAEGPRFENLVALHLLKLCHLLEDRDGWRTELRYLRDADGRELDFVVTVKGKPWIAVEAKLGDEAPSREFLSWKEQLGIGHCFLLSRDGRRDVVKKGVRCVPAWAFLGGLP